MHTCHEIYVLRGTMLIIIFIETTTQILYRFNSFGLGDAIWRHRPWSTLAQVMAWCQPGNNPLPQLNSLRPRQNGRNFADDTFKCIFLNENISISIKISLKFVPNGPINNIPALVQIMAWRRPGNKPLSEPMMVNLPTHICVTRPQWVNDKPIRWHIYMYHQASMS